MQYAETLHWGEALHRADAHDPAAELAARQRVMALCAEATRSELEAALTQFGETSGAEDIRRPETGLVMLRGRMGGDKRPFNFGEATVTRVAVRLPSGGIGFAYQLGRDTAKARSAAILDALWQTPEHRERVEQALSAVHKRLDGESRTRERQTAATRVNFFTMVRGED